MVFWLPPYSPDFTPVESAFSFVKQYLKKHEVLQAMTNPIPLIQSAFDSITPILASIIMDHRLWILILIQTWNCENINAFFSIMFNCFDQQCGFTTGSAVHTKDTTGS